MEAAAAADGLKPTPNNGDGSDGEEISVSDAFVEDDFLKIPPAPSLAAGREDGLSPAEAAVREEEMRAVEAFERSAGFGNPAGSANSGDADVWDLLVHVYYVPLNYRIKVLTCSRDCVSRATWQASPAHPPSP